MTSFSLPAARTSRDAGCHALRHQPRDPPSHHARHRLRDHLRTPGWSWCIPPVSARCMPPGVHLVAILRFGNVLDDGHRFWHDHAFEHGLGHRARFRNEDDPMPRLGGGRATRRAFAASSNCTVVRFRVARRAEVAATGGTRTTARQWWPAPRLLALRAVPVDQHGSESHATKMRARRTARLDKKWSFVYRKSTIFDIRNGEAFDMLKTMNSERPGTTRTRSTGTRRRGQGSGSAGQGPRTPLAGQDRAVAGQPDDLRVRRIGG